jgi:hypothetical protein
MVLTAVVVMAFAACAPSPASGGPVAVAAPMQWEPVTVEASLALTEGPARVLPAADAVAVVTAPFRARVIAVRVRAGDEVLANAPLLEVVMPEVLDAAARFDGATGRLAAATDRLGQLTRLRDEGLARAVEVTEAAARVADARADRQLALATLRAAGVREADAPALVAAGSLTLRAPRAGVVTDVAATLGSAAEPTSGPLVRLSAPGLGRVEARFAHPINGLLGEATSEQPASESGGRQAENTLPAAGNTTPVAGNSPRAPGSSPPVLGHVPVPPGSRPVAGSPRAAEAANGWELQVGERRWPLTLHSAAPGADSKDGTFLAWFDGVDLPRADTLGRVVRSASGSAPSLFRVSSRAIAKEEGRTVVRTHAGAVAVEVKSCTATECLVAGALKAGDAVQVGR